MNKEIVYCPQCGALFKETKRGFKELVFYTVAKLVTFMDPAPTTCVGKAENIYHCPNCAHEWSE